MKLLKKIFLKISSSILILIGGIVCFFIALFMAAMELIFIVCDKIDKEELK